MEVKVEHVALLLEMLSEKTGQPLDLQGFGEMSGELKDINKKYLYENLFLNKEKAKKKGIATLNLQHTKVDALAKFLGYKNFREFEEKIDRSPDKVLLSCVGSYRSYVRRNSETGVLFSSPVQIYERGGKVWYQLKGPKWTYEGEVELKNGCLFVLLRAGNGKQLHHVYKIGTREHPRVLQGIFSGVSTAFDPIGGRTVLVNAVEKFSQLKGEELEIAKLRKSKLLLLRRLAGYFQKYEDNNTSSKKVIAFDETDLGTCK